MDFLIDSFAQAQAWLYESCFQPLLFALGFGGLLESAYEATGWLLVGVLQLLVMLLAFAPLQWWRPAQVISDRAAIRTDVLYTLIHRLGLFRVAMFFTLEPLLDQGVGTLRVWGMPTFQIDDLWPQVTATPWVSFVLYLVIFDFCNYWFHRAQHHFGWWWKLHALHHSQQQMTMWTDNRNHLLDDVLRDVLFVAVGVLIGIAPGQFVALVALMQLSENLQHANVRLSFGKLGERLWVSPRFHRLHHGIGIGHESAPPPSGSGKTVLGGHNFGVLLPWWDMLFGTADFSLRYLPTGVRDQVEQGVNYGQGFWDQQWRGLLRLAGRHA